MVTLWIGDFRAKQLQTIYKAAQQTAEYHYLVDDFAEYSWLIDNVTKQLPSLSLESANVVIMLGFNDCVYSCVWDSFDIENIAKQYTTAINTLIADYPDFNFYVCSVTPIDNNYPFAECENGIITKKKLEGKIKTFNNILKADCENIYIDSYEYLAATGFSTRDGIRYTTDTCKILHNYISDKVNYNRMNAFLPRISAPDPEVDTYFYWTAESAGGVNPFSAKNGEAGFTLPDSAAYAWGRFYEILGEEPKLSTDSANKWYSYSADGYKRGDTPRVGAIACWISSNGGFVAVVEQVKSDGSIITSESDWSTDETDDIWRLTNRVLGENKNWGMTGYTFQGFIYCPQTIGVSKEELCTKNSYSISIEEMKPNAQYIYQYLSTRGWTLNAVAGLLGNLQVESKMSPNVWESIIAGTNTDGTLNMTAINNYYTSHGRYPGFGLVQWTPYTKYTDWCNTNDLDYIDMDSQLQRIDWETRNNVQWIARPSKGYDLSFADFISSTRAASWLAEAFAFCYERPGSSTGTVAQQNALRAERGSNGDFWYSYLSSLSFSNVENTRPKVSNFKIKADSATQASMSFLVGNCSFVKYFLIKGKNEIESEIISIKDGYKTIYFKELLPKTKYTVKLEVTSKEAETITRELFFETAQDYPTDVEEIAFTALDKQKIANGLFSLKVVKPSYLGYWQDNSGYDVYLIVNNNIVKSLTVKDANKNISWSSFTLEDKFGYTYKADDSVQIGIKTWVKDDKGTKLFANTVATISRPISLLNKPITVYLNK